MVISDENARYPSAGKIAGQEAVQIQVYISDCAKSNSSMSIVSLNVLLV